MLGKEALTPLEYAQKELDSAKAALERREALLVKLKNPATLSDKRNPYKVDKEFTDQNRAAQEFIDRGVRVGVVTRKWNETIIPRAENRLKDKEARFREVATATAGIERLRELTATGDVPESLLQAAESRLAAIPWRGLAVSNRRNRTEQTDKPTDISAVKGPDVVLPVVDSVPTVAAIAPEKEERQLPKIELDEKSGIMTVDGKAYHLSPGQLAAVKPLYDSEGKPIPTRELNKLVRDLGYSSDPAITYTKIESRYGVEFFKRIRDAATGYAWALPRYIEPAKPPAAEDSGKKEFGEEPVSDVVLNVLSEIISNPNITAEQAIELRGPNRMGRPFTKPNLDRSLSSNLNVLMNRSRRGLLTGAEQLIVDAIHGLYAGDSIKNSLIAMRKNVIDWLKNGTPIDRTRLVNKSPEKPLDSSHQTAEDRKNDTDEGGAGELANPAPILPLPPYNPGGSAAAGERVNIEDSGAGLANMPEEPLPGPILLTEGINTAEERRARQLQFSRTLPGGLPIIVVGSQRVETFDLIFGATKENPVSSDVVDEHRVSRLRQFLRPFGWNITNSESGVGGKKGQKALYYPEKSVKIDPETAVSDAGAETETITAAEVEAEWYKSKIASLQASRAEMTELLKAGTIDQKFIEDIDAELRELILKQELSGILNQVEVDYPSQLTWSQLDFASNHRLAPSDITKMVAGGLIIGDHTGRVSQDISFSLLQTATIIWVGSHPEEANRKRALEVRKALQDILWQRERNKAK